MDDNVIVGPWSARLVSQSETDNEVKATVDNLAKEFSDAIFDAISNSGFNNSDDMCYSKDYALLVHAIKSVLYRLDNRYHPLQDVAEHLFTMYTDGSLSFNKYINVEFE